jgi:hypothetical protein
MLFSVGFSGVPHMVRHVSQSACWVFCLAIACATMASITQAQEVHPIVQLGRKLAEPVDFPGLDQVPLRDTIGFLEKKYGLNIDFNLAALRDGGGAAASLPSADDVQFTAAQERGGPAKVAPTQAAPTQAAQGKGGTGKTSDNKAAPPGKGAAGAGAAAKEVPAPPPNGAPIDMDCLITLPKMQRVRLETLLKRILAQVPMPPAGPLDYVLRREGIEITTTHAKIAEFYRAADRAAAADAPFAGGGVGPPPPPPIEVNDTYLPPLIQAQFDRTPFAEALKTLANTTDQTILLDPRAGEKPLPVTATLLNVPLDTAVELLANMAGLAVVTRDRVLYVTSKDNGEAMQRELRERTMGQRMHNPGLGALGGVGGMLGLGGGAGGNFPAGSYTGMFGIGGGAGGSFPGGGFAGMVGIGGGAGAAGIRGGGGSSLPPGGVPPSGAPPRVAPPGGPGAPVGGKGGAASGVPAIDPRGAVFLPGLKSMLWCGTRPAASAYSRSASPDLAPMHELATLRANVARLFERPAHSPNHAMA